MDSSTIKRMVEWTAKEIGRDPPPLSRFDPDDPLSVALRQIDTGPAIYWCARALAKDLSDSIKGWRQQEEKYYQELEAQQARLFKLFDK
jgi:hypothetical protein